MTRHDATLRDIERFRAMIADRLGLQFDDTRAGTLVETLSARIASTGAAAEHYLDSLSGTACPPGEWGVLAQQLAVTETYFFRNPEQLGAFAEIALVERLAVRERTGPVSILSAGCASGEEPYSLAILLRETAPEVSAAVSIRGVDVNAAMLARARAATFSAWALRGATEARRARWFRRTGAAFVLDDAIRDAVEFEERNLAVDDPGFWRPASYDIVLCRNVLMYLTPSAASALVARITRCLMPGGYLFLGHAETLRGLSNDFHLCHTHEAFYYQRKPGGPRGEPSITAREPFVWPIPAAAPDVGWVDAVRGASERIDTLARASSTMPKASAGAQSAALPAPDLRDVLDLMRRERFGEVLDQLGALPPGYEREPDVLLLRAVSLAHAGELTAAEEVCHHLLACDELNAGAHYVLALCREHSGDLAGASMHDSVALYLDQGFAMARLHLGLLARRRGERDAACHALTEALAALQREDTSRLILFGGGFGRSALIAICRAELAACGGRV